MTPQNTAPQNPAQPGSAAGRGTAAQQGNAAGRGTAAQQGNPADDAAADDADARQTGVNAEETLPDTTPEERTEEKQELVEAGDADVPLAETPEEAPEGKISVSPLVWLLILLTAAAAAWILFLFFRKKKEKEEQ